MMKPNRLKLASALRKSRPRGARPEIVIAAPESAVHRGVLVKRVGSAMLKFRR